MAENNTFIRTQRKLERLELEHLRQLVADQHQQIEDLQFALQDANICADLWNNQALMLQEALHDDKFATHRSVGITKTGELMVVAHQ